jgi:hypothetical protein
MSSMTTKEKILASLAPVLAAPQFVTIDSARIDAVAHEFLNEPVPAWDNEQQLFATPEETAQYYFFLDSINFCFWGPKGEPRWERRINEEWVGGYYAYARAVKDAFMLDRRFMDPEFLAGISEKDFDHVFNGRNGLLLMPERLTIIRENFAILAQDFHGSAFELVKGAHGDADKLVATLVEKFPTFRDGARFDGKEVLFLKRAQIFPSDMAFSGIPELKLGNLDHLTVFADYKLPQLFVELGIFAYAPELLADITAQDLIEPGSRKEIEIRASTISACERLAARMQALGRAITTNELDWILWVKAKGMKLALPHHRTLTTAY